MIHVVFEEFITIAVKGLKSEIRYDYFTEGRPIFGIYSIWISINDENQKLVGHAIGYWLYIEKHRISWWHESAWRFQMLIFLHCNISSLFDNWK